MTKLKSHDGYYLWKYVPSLAAAVIFLIIFLILTGLHLRRVYQTRLWFCGVFALGGVFEVIGFIGRAAAQSSTAAIGPYVVQNIFLLLAPTLFAASIYMTLGRIIRSVKGEHHSPIRPKWLTWAFVSGDLLSFVVQGNSAPLSILNLTLWAEVAVLAGLGIQLVSFLLFGITAIVFGKRLRKSPTSETFNKELPWKQTLYMLYSVSALVLVRSAFRIIEFAMGSSGYPLTHEWTLYCFDSVLMVAVMIIFYVWYPSKLRVIEEVDIVIPLTNNHKMV